MSIPSDVQKKRVKLHSNKTPINLGEGVNTMILSKAYTLPPTHTEFKSRYPQLQLTHMATKLKKSREHPLVFATQSQTKIDPSSTRY